MHPMAVWSLYDRIIIAGPTMLGARKRSIITRPSMKGGALREAQAAGWDQTTVNPSGRNDLMCAGPAQAGPAPPVSLHPLTWSLQAAATVRTDVASIMPARTGICGDHAAASKRFTSHQVLSGKEVRTADTDCSKPGRQTPYNARRCRQGPCHRSPDWHGWHDDARSRPMPRRRC